MDKKQYEIIEQYMLECMKDSAHDRLHIYRVLYHAVEIAKNYNVDNEVLIAATLLHDIGREEQFRDPRLDHAVVGASKARVFLEKQTWAKEKVDHVCDCIRTHRFRSDSQPVTIEARILFDADKLDVTGAIGIARTLVYKGAVGQKLYSVNDAGMVVHGHEDNEPTFFREYTYKLEGLYSKFYTQVAGEMAKKRMEAAKRYYEDISNEMVQLHENGQGFLEEVLT